MQISVEVANFASRSKFVVINALELGQSGNNTDTDNPGAGWIVIFLSFQMKSPGVRQDWVVELRLARLVSFSLRIKTEKSQHFLLISGSRP